MVISIINLDKCIEKFGDISNIDVMPVIKDGVRKVQRTAKELCPNVGGYTPSGYPSKSTGDLRRSIKTKLYPKEQSGIVYSILEYAIYQEFGTRKMKAQPFMIPAMNYHRDGISQDMRNYLKSKVREKAK